MHRPNLACICPPGIDFLFLGLWARGSANINTYQWAIQRCQSLWPCTSLTWTQLKLILLREDLPFMVQSPYLHEHVHIISPLQFSSGANATFCKIKTQTHSRGKHVKGGCLHHVGCAWQSDAIVTSRKPAPVHIKHLDALFRYLLVQEWWARQKRGPTLRPDPMGGSAMRLSPAGDRWFLNCGKLRLWRCIISCSACSLWFISWTLRLLPATMDCH